jgi:hypothetical protein
MQRTQACSYICNEQGRQHNKILKYILPILSDSPSISSKTLRSLKGPDYNSIASDTRCVTFDLYGVKDDGDYVVLGFGAV